MRRGALSRAGTGRCTTCTVQVRYIRTRTSATKRCNIITICFIGNIISTQDSWPEGLQRVFPRGQYYKTFTTAFRHYSLRSSRQDLSDDAHCQSILNPEDLKSQIVRGS